jgi:hypothetical protein
MKILFKAISVSIIITVFVVLFLSAITGYLIWGSSVWGFAFVVSHLILALFVALSMLFYDYFRYDK